MSQGTLLNFLLKLQGEYGGVIPFEKYMQEALYNSTHGYYSSQITGVGAAGDFSTSATLDPHLGMAIAAWICKRAGEFSWHKVPVIEIGAGSGELASNVLRHLDWKTRLRINYQIHETSAVLRNQQKERLRWRCVHWIDDLGSALDQSNGRSLIFSNELVDAFPCKLFQKIGTEWNELGVTISADEGLREKSIGKIAQNPWFHNFNQLPEGQRIERHDSFRLWLESWSGHWKEGAMLTIDYGDLVEKIYERRPEGSLRAYWNHQRFTGRDIYARFGKQDITANVNFSDLIAWGAQLGWKNNPLITQQDFITTLFSGQVKRLRFLEDARTSFKVLEQAPCNY